MARTWAFISFKIFLSSPNISKKKGTHRLQNPKSGHCGGRKNGILGFFYLKSHFLPKTPRKHPREIIKPINGHQKANKSSQNPKSTRNKNYSQA
jgi:hypothetical protein